jgi:subtilisin family serine protease
MDSTKKFILRALLVLMGMLFGIEASAQKAVEFVPGVVMVKFQYGKISRVTEKIGLDDISSLAVQRFLSSRGFKAGTKIFKGAAVGDTIAVALTGEPVKVLDLSHWFIIELDPGADVIGAADSLRLFPGVLAATPATVFRLQDTFPNDTHFQSGWQWGLHNYSSPGKDIRAVQAWDINRGRSDVVVAVVDGGVDYNHTDLDPGNRSRVIQGTDTGDDDSDPMDDLPEGGNLWGNHGTRVAGVIGAITNNAAGVAGIMWNCSIMPVKVGNSGGWGPFNWGAGSAFEWDIADGINLGTHSWRSYY